LASSMRPESPVEIVILGPEYDDRLRECLVSVLQELGARTASSSWGLGGSQELQEIQAVIGNEIITIESETYVGLSIQGNPDLIHRIANSIRQRMQKK
jgi:hypothetical protein